MNITFAYGNMSYSADLAAPLDISIPLRHGADNPSAFCLPAPSFAPFRAGSFVGATADGGPCNCYTLRLAPHGNGTHTECIGHIAAEPYFLNNCLKKFMAFTILISVEAVEISGDRIVTERAVAAALGGRRPEAVVLRTLPNHPEKRTMQWSGTNPPYLEPGVGTLLAALEIEHLVLDLPSVDKEEDGGELAAHHAFWRYPEAPRTAATITEMAFIPDEIPDGEYLLGFSVMPVESDASPSKPMLYAIRKI